MAAGARPRRWSLSFDGGDLTTSVSCESASLATCSHSFGPSADSNGRAGCVCPLGYRARPGTIVGARRLADSSNVTLDIRNDATRSNRLYAVDLLARAGRNWVFIGNVPLGFTNSSERSISIDVNFPERPRPWKARLVYMPAFSPSKLLWWRLSEAWKTKRVSQGFRRTGWEGGRHAYS